MSKPIVGTFPAYFSQYISKVPEEDLSEAFKNQQEIMADFFNGIPEIKWEFAYAPGKWTLKEMLQHLIDTERIFAYRSLCIARKETQSLPGFNENEYAANSYANARNWQSLVEELKLVRQTTEMLFKNFTAQTLNQSGFSSHNPVTVNALGFISVGHIYHHLQVIKEKYI